MDYQQRNMNVSRNKKIVTGCWLMLTGAALMLFATRSSFLYPCNNWNDANSYFSVGKALFNGKMPYRDVFDQKGMFLYFFYGLAYLVSHTTFAGVFLMEILLAFFDLVGFFHILQLYVKRTTSLLLCPLVLAVIVSSDSFYWGGSAEEVCLPFLIWGLYLSLDYFKNQYPEKEMNLKVIFAGGILAGMVANIKFTVLGFFFAWMMCVAFSFLVRRDLMGAVKGCMIFLCGMAIPFIPWVIYFGIQKSLYEWYYGYVYLNVSIYSNLNGEGPRVTERIYTLSKLLYWVIRDNMIYFAFIMPGAIWFLFDRNKKWLERFLLLALCFFLFLGIYVGGSQLPYYALPLAVFTVTGFAFLGQILEWITEKTVKRKVPAEKRMWMKKAGLLLSVILGIGVIFTTSMNIPFMKEKKEDLFLYQFKEIVDQTDHPTLLNIGCLDAGLYTVCDIVPTCRWFQTQPLALDDVSKEQERYIREGQTTFIIARDSYPEVIWENYELAASVPWYHEGTEFTYYLFRRKTV